MMLDIDVIYGVIKMSTLCQISKIPLQIRMGRDHIKSRNDCVNTQSGFTYVKDLPAIRVGHSITTFGLVPLYIVSSEPGNGLSLDKVNSILYEWSVSTDRLTQKPRLMMADNIVSGAVETGLLYRMEKEFSVGLGGSHFWYVEIFGCKNALACTLNYCTSIDYQLSGIIAEINKNLSLECVQYLRLDVCLSVETRPGYKSLPSPGTVGQFPAATSSFNLFMDANWYNWQTKGVKVAGPVVKCVGGLLKVNCYSCIKTRIKTISNQSWPYSVGLNTIKYNTFTDVWKLSRRHAAGNAIRRLEKLCQGIETAPEATTEYRFEVSVRSYSFSDIVQDLINIVVNSEWRIIKAKKYLPLIKEKAFTFIYIIQDKVGGSTQTISNINLPEITTHDTEVLSTPLSSGQVVNISNKVARNDHINITVKNLYDVILVETLLIEGFLKGRKNTVSL